MPEHHPRSGGENSPRMDRSMTPSVHARHWKLAPELLYLNHGSFGACPSPVLDAQVEFQRRMEANPVGFLGRELEPLLDEARMELARFLGADPATLAFLPNITTAVNTVLRAFPFEPGDEILVTDHEYNACRNALDVTAERTGARIAIARVPFPVGAPEEVEAAVLARQSQRTRFALLDHVTSPTAIVQPVGRLAGALEERGVAVMIDGAHAPGMLPLDLDRLGASFYGGNCHKWLCAPKGAGFLWVRADRAATLRPLVTSHGANSPRTDRTRFRLEFDWVGTQDFSPYLCVPVALRFLGGLLPGGWPEIYARNHSLACEGRRILCDLLGLEPPCPEEMLGSMAAVVLPGGAARMPASASEKNILPQEDALERELFERHRIVVPIFRWPEPPMRILRISAQLYNSAGQFRLLGETVRGSLRAGV